jgi:hypothetical protein
MLNKFFILSALLAGLFLCTEQSHAQSSTVDISQIKYLYEELRFEESIQLGQNILKKEETLSAQQLEYIHQYVAFSFYNVGNTDSARVHFLSLLTINPDKELNTLDTSPKIIEFFNQIKANLEEIHTTSNIVAYSKYIFIEDKRPDAAWRSAILPGWGQYYKGQHSRAYILGGTFLTSAIILGVSIINENKYKDAYLSSTNPAEISNNYDKYNNWSKARQISTYTTVGLWLLSFADALWSDYSRIEVEISDHQLSSVAISFKFNF